MKITDYRLRHLYDNEDVHEISFHAIRADFDNAIDVSVAAVVTADDSPAPAQLRWHLLRLSRADAKKLASLLAKAVGGP